MTLFMVHGVLYYLFPQFQYTSMAGGTSYIQLIKYACVLIALPLVLKFRFSQDDLRWVSIGLFYLVSTLPLSLYWAEAGNSLLLQFQLPILAYFFAPFAIRFFSSERRTTISLYFILILTLASMWYDFVQGGVFVQFSRSGLRSAGPFVNPNNSGIFLAIVAGLLHLKTKRLAVDLTVASASVVIMALSGSKTAMLIYAFGVSVMIVRKPRLLLFVAFSVVVGLSVGMPQFSLDSFGLREFSFESGDIRYTYATRALSAVGAQGSTDIFFGTFNYSIVDNGYLDIIAFGGLFLLMIFLAAQLSSVFILLRNRQWMLLVVQIQIAMAMMTTNIPRLWPTAYLFWALVGVSFLLYRKKGRAPRAGLRELKGRRIVHG